LQGKRVAHSNYAKGHYQSCGAIDNITGGVERAGQCITAGSDEDARAFADAIDQALRGSP
jgi:hypothetical protein